MLLVLVPPPPPKQGISGVVLTNSNMSYHKAIRVTNPTYFYWIMPERVWGKKLSGVEWSGVESWSGVSRQISK